MNAAFSRVLIVLAASLGLGGCFQPLHGGALSNSAATLAQIEVTPIEGHLGHQVKSELDFLLSNGSPPDKPLYRLRIQPKGTSSGIVADSAQGRPQVMSYSVSANYQLVSIADGNSVASGTAAVTTSFDRTQQRFATVRALRDAEIRAAKMLAEQIRIRITPGLFAPKS